jgi:hypothetical protein
MREFRLIVAALITISNGASAQAVQPPVPTNEWPDPNYYIQDTSKVIPAINDALTGLIPAINVTGHTTGSRTVTVNTSSTADMLVGQYVSFASPCDAALKATIVQIQSIVPDTSFNVTLEYPSGTPSVSTPCAATLVQHGDTVGFGGGDITSNVHRFANASLWPSFWISNRPAHLALLNAGANVLIVRKVTNAPEEIYWNATTPSMMAGTQRAFGAAVYVANGSGAAAQAYISAVNGVTVLGSIATSASRTWTAVYDDVPSTSTVFQEGEILTGPAGSTFVIGETESVPYPTMLPDHAFAVPRAQTAMTLASISPYVGVSFTLPAGGNFDVNMGQASNLVISGGVTTMIGNLEGQSTTFPAVLSVASPESPTVYGPPLHQLIDPSGHGGDPLYYAFGSGSWPLRNDHLLMYGTRGSTWNFVSWDIQGFVLLAGP